MMESIEKLRYYAKTICCIDGDVISRFADEIEREIAERYMELPVDADGVPIHLYDKLLKSTGAAKPTYGEVVGISDDSVFFDAKQGWEANWSKLTRHVKPRTIEDVLKEFAYKVCDLSVDDAELERYADELRQMGVGE